MTTAGIAAATSSVDAGSTTVVSVSGPSGASPTPAPMPSAPLPTIHLLPAASAPNIVAAPEATLSQTISVTILPAS